MVSLYLLARKGFDWVLVCVFLCHLLHCKLAVSQARKMGSKKDRERSRSRERRERSRSRERRERSRSRERRDSERDRSSRRSGHKKDKRSRYRLYPNIMGQNLINLLS